VENTETRQFTPDHFPRVCEWPRTSHAESACVKLKDLPEEMKRGMSERSESGQGDVGNDDGVGASGELGRDESRQFDTGRRQRNRDSIDRVALLINSRSTCRDAVYM
jgi:hypothetical protein